MAQSLRSDWGIGFHDFSHFSFNGWQLVNGQLAIIFVSVVEETIFLGFALAQAHFWNKSFMAAAKTKVAVWRKTSKPSSESLVTISSSASPFNWVSKLTSLPLSFPATAFFCRG